MASPIAEAEQPMQPDMMFHRLLAALQQEYWRVCKDRDHAEQELGELRATLRAHGLLGRPSVASMTDVSLQVEDGHSAAVPWEREVLGAPGLFDRSKPAPSLGAVSAYAAGTAPAGTISRAVTPAVTSNDPRTEVCTEFASSRAVEDHLERDMLSGLDDEERPVRISAMFPEWWNPMGGRADYCSASVSISNMALSSEGEIPIVSPFMISPVSKKRLLWDLVAATFLLYETWATPFLLFFIRDGTDIAFMTVVDILTLAFFSSDIVLNFNTGVLVRGELSMDRRVAASEYVKSWFWLDLAATLPFDYVLMGGGVFTSALRILRGFKLLKTLRYLRLVRLTRALQQSESTFEIISSLKTIWTSLGFVVGMVFFIHVHSCVWASIRSDLGGAETFQEGVKLYTWLYYETGILIFSAMSLRGESTAECIFEMIIVTYRVFLTVALTTVAVFKYTSYYFDREVTKMRTNSTIAYLRQHKVPARTQIQVLYGLYEAGQVKTMQKDFKELMDSDLPAELQRIIMRELWSTKLLSLGLLSVIDGWEPLFIADLATRCYEETFASRSVLFRDGDASFSAYCLTSGIVCISGGRLKEPMADYLQGMWLGENALVNPAFCRGFAAITRTLCRVMNLPVQAFHDLLKQHDVATLFQDWCTKELWRGVCGRCGQVGDHFSDDCRTARIYGGGNAVTSTMSLGREPSKELQAFLKHYNLGHILSALQSLGVHDLHELEELNLETLLEKLMAERPPTRLSAHDHRVLHPRQIQRFRQDMAKGTQYLLEQCPNNEHLIFISHYKLEAGTEAALMRTELQSLLRDMPQHVGSRQSVPIFLDSDNLKSLNDVQATISKSHNLVLLLTNGVLARPWCLLEVVTAVNFRVPVVPVEVAKPGNEFIFPNDDFYKRLLEGKLLAEADEELLISCKVNLQTIERCLREVFKSITVTYSPHRPAELRHAELTKLLGRCTKLETPFARAANSTHELRDEEHRTREYTTKALEWLWGNARSSSS